MKKTVYFTECEHMGDLNNYVDDLVESGATIISKNITPEDEEGRVVIEVQDEQWENFITKFEETNSFDFSNLQ